MIIMDILIVSNTTKNNYSCIKDIIRNNNISFGTIDTYADQIKEFEYVIAGREPYTSEILSESNLKVISRCGHGTDAIDNDYCSKNGIKVLDARGALDDTMADITIGYIIMSLRRLCSIDTMTRRDGWMPLIGNDLTGKTVGIIGLGGIGTAVAKRLQCFRTNTLFYDIDRNKHHDYEYAKFLSLDELYKRSDVITLHCDLNKGNKNMIDRNVFEKMKDGSLLINTARGGLVDTTELRFAIIRKDIHAVLDVYPEEPLNDSLLRKIKNIILGSHSACYSIEGQKKLAIKAAENMIGVLNG